MARSQDSHLIFLKRFDCYATRNVRPRQTRSSQNINYGTEKYEPIAMDQKGGGACGVVGSNITGN